MLIILVLLTLIGVVYAYVQLPKFGKTPSGERFERAKKSPNFRDGKFQNLSHTPDLTEGVGYFEVIRKFLFAEKERTKPTSPFPTVKTDLHTLHQDENVLVWFGHSSYFMQIDGKRMLVDPVLSGAASPFRFTTPSFKGTDVYTAADIPEIDFLFISHDHWDHLDHQTILLLKPKIGQVICGLGTGAHCERWGYDASKIIEKDWNETIPLGEGFVVHTTSARHFSGRSFVRNKALWTSFVLQTPSKRIFMGGDSGYGTHFADIGKAHGPFDLAILECGQYDKNWKYIHMMPEEVPQAAQDLRAKRLLPVHWAKFEIANHPWDDPIIRVAAASKSLGIPFLHPMIGEKSDLDSETQVFSEWWKGVE
ncbi:MAG: MBL fold metallo-hydrolase [Phycisphaerae bacterium]|nr:MBL fold metallo-hydrolase [Saprospiraceae bacterium]